MSDNAAKWRGWRAGRRGSATGITSMSMRGSISNITLSPGLHQHLSDAAQIAREDRAPMSGSAEQRRQARRERLADLQEQSR